MFIDIQIVVLEFVHADPFLSSDTSSNASDNSCKDNLERMLEIANSYMFYYNTPLYRVHVTHGLSEMLCNGLGLYPNGP